MSSPQEIVIYTDGAAAPNPGPGGYGAVILYNGHRKELAEGFALTTNNRMEILGVVVGLEALTKPCHVTIYSDSQYVVNAISEGWVQKWKRNLGWKTKKERAKNWDLWLRYLEAAAPHHVNMLWIRGHAGNVENERADVLAVEAGQRPNNPPDAGYEAALKGDPAADLFGG